MKPRGKSGNNLPSPAAGKVVGNGASDTVSHVASFPRIANAFRGGGVLVANTLEECACIKGATDVTVFRETCRVSRSGWTV